jgi:Family of unknown function (DUF6535)
MRAFFTNGVVKQHIPWAIEGLPMLLHLSLFLFFGGLVIFLFSTNDEVFVSVVWWIGLFLNDVWIDHASSVTIIRHDSPHNAPLYTLALSVFASILSNCGSRPQINRS